MTVGTIIKRAPEILRLTDSTASTTDSTLAAKSIKTLVSTAMSMARRGAATIDDGQTLLQELLAFRLRELVHLWAIFLHDPSSNRFPVCSGV